MREIKFRIWDMDRKVMLGSQRVIFYDEDFYENFRDFEDGILIENIVVMQSTGLIDKHGFEIYEGDIVRDSKVVDDISIVRFGEFGVPNFEKLEYQDIALGFYFEDASEYKDVSPFNMTIPLNSCRAEDVEIIGNIYQNKELLESKKD